MLISYHFILKMEAALSSEALVPYHFILKMEAALSSETFLYPATLLHGVRTSEDRDMNFHPRENLKFSTTET